MAWQHDVADARGEGLAAFVCGGGGFVRILERKPTEWTVNWRSTLPQHDRMRRRSFLMGGLALAASSTLLPELQMPAHTSPAPASGPSAVPSQVLSDILTPMPWSFGLFVLLVCLVILLACFAVKLLFKRGTRLRVVRAVRSGG